jgi:hypothetical protein
VEAEVVVLFGPDSPLLRMLLIANQVMRSVPGQAVVAVVDIPEEHML